jgi:hypothetical protein
MKSTFKLASPLWVRSATVLAIVAGLAPAQTNINPAARKHVKMIGGQPFKYSSKLAKVIELNFTFGFNHSDSKPLIAATLTRVATNYGTGGVPAFTVQRHVGPSNGTASGLPTPDFTLADLLSGQVIFANQISAMGTSTLGTTRQQAIQTAIETEGRGYFALHGSGDNQATGWPWYTNTLHPMNYQGHGDRTPGPVYKNPVEKEHIVTENVLTTGMLAASQVPTSVDGSGNEVLTSEPTRNITNEWYRFGTDIRTVPAMAAKLTVLSLYDPRNLTAAALGATYKRKGGNMYTYLFKVGNGMTHYLPAGHDNSEIMASGGFDGGVGDWDRYFAQTLFFLAGYNVTACDTSCNGLPIVSAENRLTGQVVVAVGHGKFGLGPRELSFDAASPAFSFPRTVDYEARLMSVSGKVLAAKKGHGSQYAFERASLIPGVYMMSVRIDNMEPLTRRYVIGAQL